VWQTTEDKSRLLHFAALGFFFVAPLCCARACGARKESFLRFYGTTPQPLLPEDSREGHIFSVPRQSHY
jgi:hypothetical protein